MRQTYQDKWKWVASSRNVTLTGFAHSHWFSACGLGFLFIQELQPPPTSWKSQIFWILGDFYIAEDDLSIVLSRGVLAQTFGETKDYLNQLPNLDNWK